MSETSSAKILVADDEPLFLRTTVDLLRKAGYACTSAADGATALEALGREPYDLLLSDLSMPGNLKLELLREGRTKWPEMPVIVITGAPSLPSAIESVRLGITDYLLKPVKYEELLSAVRRALAQRARRRNRGSGTAAPDLRQGRFPGMVGESAAMHDVYEIIERVADTDANVLLTGESGVGKEVVARAIHERSQRCAGKFLVVDCTAIPETLFESALFGHVKGSFTGAIKDQAGLLSQADGGTAFFDEIGELPLPLQAKLLRVIQEQTFTPVGRTEPLKVDARFISATNRDLELEVNAARFRQDLFYRLAVIHVELPPLRERGEDVVLLARHFLEQLQPGDHGRVADFSEESLELLRAYQWPGNVRELRNAVERGLALARGELIVPADLPVAIQRAVQAEVEDRSLRAPAGSRAGALEGAERDYLISLLRDNAGNVAQSARQAGMSRQGLHKLLRKHGVSADEYRA
jgi:two-component system response regulator HydG